MIALAGWARLAATGGPGPLERAVPDGSPIQLVVHAWNGGILLAGCLPALTVLLVVAVVVIATAGVPSRSATAREHR